MSKPIIAVAFYSTYGHVAQLAESVIKGVEASGAIVKPYQFQETLSEEVLSKMHAGSSLRPKYPILKPDDLKEVDGLVIGAPTRYGRVPAQVSAFFDQCGGLWFTGALVGKFVTMFTSAAGQHGGHETTALTTIPFFVHQGMCFVPLGFTDPKINALDTVIGGAPWGASTVAASDGSRQPQESELAVAEHQGKFFADFVGTFVRGKQQKLVGATSGASVPVLGKVVPVNVDSEGEKEGYQVPKTDKETLTDVTPTGATPAESKDGAVTGPTEKVSQPEPGLNAAVPATAATPVPAVGPTPIASRPPQSEKKEKKGLFASCCGGRGIEN